MTFLKHDKHIEPEPLSVYGVFSDSQRHWEVTFDLVIIVELAI